VHFSALKAVIALAVLGAGSQARAGFIRAQTQYGLDESPLAILRLAQFNRLVRDEVTSPTCTQTIAQVQESDSHKPPDHLPHAAYLARVSAGTAGSAGAVPVVSPPDSNSPPLRPAGRPAMWRPSLAYWLLGSARVLLPDPPASYHFHPPR